MIVVWGSIIVDLLFAVPRLPRLGETVLGERYRVMAGGKGANQAVAAARDGAEVVMVGAVGRDDLADTALKGLVDAGVDVEGVRRTDDPTGAAAVGVDASGGNQIMVAVGANARVRADWVADALLGPGVTLLVQMELPLEETAALIARARRKGCRIVLNLAPALDLPLEAVRAVDWLVVNEIEAAALAARCGASGDSAAGLSACLGVAVVVTYGAKGASACLDGQALAVDALAVEAVDTTGAGDAFTGVLAAALDQGETASAALRRAAVAGSLSCTAHGAREGLPDRPAIDRVLSGLAATRRG